MKKGIISVAIVFLAGLGFLLLQRKNNSITGEAMTNSKQRAIWENQMLADPQTGKIPNNVRSRELEFANSVASESRSQHLKWEWLGPNNIGGRTRALQYDITNHMVLLAGSASGGIFRSEDGGKSWNKVSTREQNLAITSIAQDKNTGSENIWYACTGELRGGNQISGNSAYAGDGILKSTDGGKTWITLNSLRNPSPQTKDSTDRGWRIIVSNQNSDVYLANTSGIYQSKDKGTNWKLVQGTTSTSGGFTDLAQTTSGTWYASFDNNAFSNYGIFRSTNGTTWTNISSGTIPAQTGRIVLATDDQFNGERIYVLAVTPNKGKAGYDFRGSVEHHSLYKYTYLKGSGTGSDGKWENLSANLPTGPEQFDDYISQSAYCIDIAVSPHDSNLVAIGGTNLYLSDDGFKTDTNTRYAGGYGEKTKIPDFQLYPNHHPDLQTIVFHPANSKILLTGSDGGIHRTQNLYATSVTWESLNTSYASTQFYTLTIDQQKKSNRLMGGLQDNGTLLSVTGKSTAPWTLPMSYDGAFCAFSPVDSVIYASKQLDGIAKIIIDKNGERTNWKRIDPLTSANYLFINPYILDPHDNNTMYLPIREELWWNEKLNEIVVDDTFDKQTKNWNKYSLPSGFQPSAIVVAESEKGIIYLGSTSGSILKIENIKSNPTTTDITNSIDGRGYINSISVDPNNSNRLMVVFSNYNTYSIFYSNNGGTNWSNISGNLEGTPTPGLPSGFEYLNNGPSCRVGKIVHTIDSTIYFVGTSVGLFQTKNLDSMNTNWEHVAQHSIQNNVVSDIKYRELDSSLWVSTFGAGVFRTHLTKSGYASYVKNTVAAINVKVFPNPTNDILNIELENLSDNQHYKLYNSLGKVTISGSIDAKTNSLSISQLAKGIYVLQIEGNGQVYFRQKVLLN